MKTGDGKSSQISYGFGDFSRSGKRFNNAYLNVRFKHNDRQSVWQVSPLNRDAIRIFLDISPEISCYSVFHSYF